MHAIVIDVPQLAVSVERESPIGAPDRYRLYFGPDIELVLTESTANHLADALDSAGDTDTGPVTAAGWVPTWATP
jgi:hypothetical protein